MKYKLVVCDMDGTLLTSSHKIYEYTANIIKQIENNGVKFIIATGRPYLDDKWIIEYEIEGLAEFHHESGYSFNIDDLDKYKNEEAAKVFFLGKNEDIENLEKNMEKEFQNDLSITVSSPFCLEFMKKGVNKAETLKKVLKLLNIKSEEVIAFGDSMNDYEMLSLVGKPFIMGNGNKRLMEALPNVEVVGNNNEDGIGKKLIEIFNIIL